MTLLPKFVLYSVMSVVSPSGHFATLNQYSHTFNDIKWCKEMQAELVPNPTRETATLREYVSTDGNEVVTTRVWCKTEGL